MQITCFDCEAAIAADGVEELEEAFLRHARSEHEWPYGDMGIRNYAAATQRLSSDTERRESIGDVEIHPVTTDRLDDWQNFFDHDAFAGKPEWAACYCLEPHLRKAGAPDEGIMRWTEQRSLMTDRLADGGAKGYLAYSDGHPVGWVNASRRSDYALYSDVDPDGPDPASVIGVSCFIIAPPYRRHGIAEKLLDRVIADAPGRGAEWLEGYPFNEVHPEAASNFRGPMSLFAGKGFVPIETRERDTVVRRPV